jgi:DNA-binding response OmpR family regulator
MSTNRLAILLVDDEISARKSSRRRLQSAGYTVVDAGNYRDAVIAYQRYRAEIGLLLTAISLPGNNGYQLARTLLEITPDLKVIFMSGQTGAEVSKYYRLPSAEERVLNKPFEAVDLLERVRTAFESGQASSGATAG